MGKGNELWRLASGKILPLISLQPYANNAHTPYIYPNRNGEVAGEYTNIAKEGEGGVDIIWC